MLLLYKYIDFNIWFPYIKVFMGFWLARGVARFVVDSYIIVHYCVILARILVVCVAAVHTVEHYCSIVALRVVHVVVVTYVVDYCFLAFNSTS